jgi:hypothetical protein
MPDNIQYFGKILIFLGLICIIAGVIFMLAGKLSWFGRLPGDIYIQKKNFSFYFPLATSLLISLILTLIFWLLRKR